MQNTKLKRRRKLILVPGPKTAKPAAIGPAEFAAWLKTGLPAELHNMFGRKEPTRMITFAVPLLKICGTYQRAGVLSRILYYAQHHPVPAGKLPEQLESRPGPWIRTSARQLHRQCCLSRSTIGRVLEWLTKVQLIDAIELGGRTYIHPRCSRIRAAIRQKRGLGL